MPGLPAHFGGTAVGKSYVDDDDIGQRQGDSNQGLGCPRRLSHHHYVIVHLEPSGHCLSHELVVVDEKYTDGHGFIISSVLSILPRNAGFFGPSALLQMQ